MQMCHWGVDILRNLVVLHENARYRNDNCRRSIVPVPRSRSAERALCPELFMLLATSCLHVDFECFKLTLWPTLRQKVMNFWSFLTRPGDKHDKQISYCSVTPQAGPSSRFFNFSHDKTPNHMVFREISFWNEMFLCWIKTEMFTVAES